MEAADAVVNGGLRRWDAACTVPVLSWPCAPAAPFDHLVDNSAAPACPGRTANAYLAGPRVAASALYGREPAPAGGACSPVQLTDTSGSQTFYEVGQALPPARFSSFPQEKGRGGPVYPRRTRPCRRRGRG